MSGGFVISQQQRNNEMITRGLATTEYRTVNVVPTGRPVKVGSCPIFRYNYAMNQYSAPFESNGISDAFKGKFCFRKCTFYCNNLGGYSVLAIHFIAFLYSAYLAYVILTFKSCTAEGIELCQNNDDCSCKYKDIDTYNNALLSIRGNIGQLTSISLIWLIYYGVFVYVMFYNCLHSKNIFALNFKARESDFYDTNEHLKVSFNQWNQMTGFAMRQNNAANARLIEAGLVTLHTKKRNTYSYV